jgi:hypothetical protein
VSERDERPADETLDAESRRQAAGSAGEGGDAGAVGALDGAAAAGAFGSVSGGKRDSVMPEEAPDPGTGPD